MRFASPLLPLAGFVSLAAATLALAVTAHANVASYRKIELSHDFFAEGATLGDLNRDGHDDAIAGPFWYEGPDFTRRHELYAPSPFDPLGYSDNFSAFVRDFNADNWPDVLLIGFPGKDASWLENPGANGGTWRRHRVYEPVDNESPTFGDLLGDGRPVLICMSLGRIGYATPDASDSTQPWTFHPVSPPGSWHHFTHGLGFGDVNGDGRADLLEKDGWWEQPASLEGAPFWKHHRANFGSGAHIHVTDVNGDKLPDVVTSLNAHGYGLAWFEQIRTADGVIDFRRHDILSSEAEPKINGVQFSQLHAVTLTDVDGDGLNDIVTGKRWWAHGPSKDPEPNAAPVIYAFLLRRGANHTASFEPHLTDDNSGVGTQLVAKDINGDNRPDFITSNKRGTAVLLSQPPQ